MDRKIVFTGQLPQDTDVLTPQKNAMIALGALSQAVIGPQAATPAFAVDGLACAATTPSPSMVLNISPGSVYAQGVVDQSAFGSLPADLLDTTILQGVSLATVPLTFVAPSTAGFAVNYLIQVGLSVQDTTPVTLPYFDAANPVIPWLGPNNSGVAQNTVRQCAAIINAKIGVAAASGSQVTPAPDPGFFSLYSVTVAQGATSLTSSNFSTVANAPFIPSTLMALPQNVQSGKWIFGVDTGTANALVVTLNPAPTSIGQGMTIVVYKGAAANTTQASINVNGAGAVAIHKTDGTVLTGAEMPPNSMLTFVFDGTFWQLETALTQNFGGPLYDGDATGTNTYTVSNLSPSAASLINRMLIKISFSMPNTSAATLNIGFGAKPIVFANGLPLSGGEITGQHLLSYNLPTTSWELLTPTTVATVPPPTLVHYGTDTSVVVNSIISTVSPAITSYAVGHIYIITSIANTNTSGITANFNGVGTRVVSRADGTALLASDVDQNDSLAVLDTGSQLQVINMFSPSGRQPIITPFTASGTWTPGPDSRNALIFCTGGGGSGALRSGGCGGAGSGATAIAYVPVLGIGPQTITIGAGGVAIISNGVSGNPGGTTIVGSFASAGGGFGGRVNPGFSGAGGVATVGNVALIPGTPGEIGTAPGGVSAGRGGGGYWGAAGLGSIADSFGYTPAGGVGGPGAFGGGGGGGILTTSGVGGNGFVLILEF